MRTICCTVIAIAGIMLVSQAGGQVTPFREGLADRTTYEQWFAGLSEFQKAGATFWATERSKRTPRACADGGQSADTPWMDACRETQQRLTPSDIRRNSEPEYRVGWNSFVSASISSSTNRPSMPYAPLPKGPSALQLREERDAQATCDPGDFLMEFDQRLYDARAVEQCQARRIAAQSLVNQRRLDDERKKREQAENSPDNLCAIRDTARSIMEEMGRFPLFKDRGIEVVDIEHLTTVTAQHPSANMACHGTFITNRGVSLIGVFSIRRNIAGDAISTWETDK